jgi:hypothetical protein
MHRRQLTVNFLVFAWLVVYTKVMYAAQVALPPFADDFYALDWESFAWAAVAGLLGGALRTVFSLASNKVVVGSLWRELIKDLVIAAVGGLVVYCVIQVVAPIWPTLFTSQVRMLAVTGAGFSRGWWATALESLVAAGLTNLQSRVRGAEVPPASVRAPLEEK